MFDKFIAGAVFVSEVVDNKKRVRFKCLSSACVGNIRVKKCANAFGGFLCRQFFFFWLEIVGVY